MNTLQTEIGINNAIAIFRNEHSGKDIGDITVRTNRSGYIVTARVDGRFERLQLPQAIVALYTSDVSDESVSSERSHCTGDTTDSFADHLLDNDFRDHVLRSEGVIDKSSVSTSE